MSAYAVFVEGLDGLPDIGALPDAITVAARQAVNRTSERARTWSAREMRSQVAFQASYLSGTDGRLRITKKASDSSLESVITGRQRATSLARFTRDSTPAAARRRGGVDVQVKPGEAKFMRGAFFLRLNAGAGRTDTRFNLGIAIRLKPGETVRNKTNMRQLDNNVYLLYGPSVDQVFRTVREDVAPASRDFLRAEFRRLIDLRGL